MRYLLHGYQLLTAGNCGGTCLCCSLFWVCFCFWWVCLWVLFVLVWNFLFLFIFKNFISCVIDFGVPWPVCPLCFANLFAFGLNNIMYWAVPGPSGKKWQHVIELLNFSCKLLLQPHLILIKDLVWNSPEESPSGITFPSSQLFCASLGVHGYSFCVCYPKLLGYFICLVAFGFPSVHEMKRDCK